MLERNASNEMFRNLALNISGQSTWQNQIRLLRIHQDGPDPPLWLGKGLMLPYETYAETITHSDPDQKYLFRILRRKDSRNFEGFLIHPVPDLYKFVFLRIQGIGHEFLTDAHGRIRGILPDIDFSKIHVVLNPPFAIFRTRSAEVGDVCEIGPDFAVADKSDIVIQMSFKRTSDKTILKVRVPEFELMRGNEKVVLIIDGERAMISAPQSGASLFEEFGGSGELQVNLYE